MLRHKPLDDGLQWRQQGITGVRLRNILKLLAAALAFLLAPLAHGQATHIAASLVPERAIVGPGDTVMLAIAMKPDAGWHGYWENGGDAGFAMQLKWQLPGGTTTGAVRYPVPETLLINGLMNHVYEHDYALLVPLTVRRDAAPGTTLPIAADADWLACTDEICVPERARIATTVRIGNPSARDARFDAWLAKLPAPLPEDARFALAAGKLRLAIPLPAALDLGSPHFFARTERTISYAAPQRFLRKGDMLLIELDAAPGAAAPASFEGVLRYGEGDGIEVRAVPGPVPSGGTPIGDPSSEAVSLPALLAILGGALLGGLILNVMPCVFPILSLKALSLARASETPAQARSDGIAYTAGTVMACLALGAVMLALRAAGAQVGWAFQLQEPLVVAGLLLLAVAITANFAGLFELPALGGNSGGQQGAFATGLLAAFVATPCTGPFMAAAMGAALVLPPPLALAVFGALGLGLALPFLLLGFVPALRRMLPGPGPWMGRFRRAMAVPMSLTALALLWLASRTGGEQFALGCAVAAVAVLGVLAVAGARQRRNLAAAVPATAAIALVIAIGAFGLPRLVSAPGRDGGTLLDAKPFSESALATERASGKPVFVYFTADWCLTCKVNESAAIERESTRAGFERGGVVVLRGDWTRRDAAITRFLASNGAAGVPLYLWYAPGSQAKVLPQVLTPALLEACAKSPASSECG